MGREEERIKEAFNKVDIETSKTQFYFIDYLCVCADVHAYGHGVQERALAPPDILKQELQVAVSCSA